MNLPSTQGHSPRGLTDIFRAHPDEIFPFPAKGHPGGFRDGEVLELSEALPAVARVTETGLVAEGPRFTSVKLTVVSDECFDDPGSTIELSIGERDGWPLLRKVAHATRAEGDVASLANYEASLTWLQQAKNFSKAVNEYER